MEDSAVEVADYSDKLDTLIELMGKLVDLLQVVADSNVRLTGLTEHMAGSWYVYLVIVVPLIYICKSLYWFFRQFM